MTAHGRPPHQHPPSDRNRADVIGYAIRSVLWQTDQDFELLIVGDGCEDNTAEVIAAFSDARIRWFDLPKGPLSGYSNRNHVLRQARGGFIAYGQDDDIPAPDHIARLIATLEDTGEDWGYSRPLWVGRDGLVMPFAVDLTQPDQLDHFLDRFNTIPSSCVAHRRDALERVGYWPEDAPRTSDWTCWQRMIKTSASGRAAYCPTPTVLHFQARWKEAETRQEEKIRAIAESGSWWPEACRIPISAGTSEQEFGIPGDGRRSRCVERSAPPGRDPGLRPLGMGLGASGPDLARRSAASSPAEAVASPCPGASGTGAGT